jgi:hypothetical protein
MKTMDDLFLHHVKDIYYAEEQIIKALPKMAKATSSPDLKKAFEHHLEETKGQVERLEQIFKILGKPVRGVRCETPCCGPVRRRKSLRRSLSDLEKTFTLRGLFENWTKELAGVGRPAAAPHGMGGAEKGKRSRRGRYAPHF